MNHESETERHSKLIEWFHQNSLTAALLLGLLTFGVLGVVGIPLSSQERQIAATTVRAGQYAVVGGTLAAVIGGAIFHTVWRDNGC